MRAGSVRLVVSLAGAVALAGTGCGGKRAAGSGGLVIVVDTDLALPRDIDRVRVEVTQSGRSLLRQEHEVGAGHLLVPAEFRVASPGNAQPVLVRAVAFKNHEARIERSAVTPVPRDRLGLVRLPLNYLCDGTATSDGTSTCGEALTCKQGTCRPSIVPQGDLPVHEGSGRDGGGEAAPGGCFDVLACFAHAVTVAVEEITCSIRAPEQVAPERINIALRVPLGGAGVCDETDCWIVIDRGPEGWTIEGDRIRLPQGVCRPRAGGGRTMVALTAACAARTAGVAICGGWSSDPTPMESPPPPMMGSEACVGAAVRSCGRCGTQTRPCLNGKWMDWTACAGEGSCAPASSQACGTGGTQTCGQDCQWQMCTGQSCTGPSVQSCGRCGTQTRGCDNGVWLAWGACTAEGACLPDAVEGCGRGGTRRCGTTCQWGECLGQTCEGPSAQPCERCGTRMRTCDNGTWSDWSGCAGQGVCDGGAMELCAAGGARTCSGACQWGSCELRMCQGADMQVCGTRCGSQKRTCDTATGNWSAWAACADEGACEPGMTRSCGNRGMQGCGGDCQWTSACTGQVCDGDATMACGNCGTRTRTCDSNTGTWSDWSACGGQGACSPGLTQTCGNQGRQTCGSSCQWSACLAPAGAPCGATAECASGLTCTDGVCCSQVCGSCSNCGSGGLCQPVAAGPDPTGSNPCIGVNVCVAGVCKIQTGTPCTDDSQCQTNACEEECAPDRTACVQRCQAMKCAPDFRRTPAGCLKDEARPCATGAECASGLCDSVTDQCVLACGMGKIAVAGLCRVVGDFPCAGGPQSCVSGLCAKTTGLCVDACPMGTSPAAGYCLVTEGLSCQNNPANCLSQLCRLATGLCVMQCGPGETAVAGFCRKAADGESCQGSPVNCASGLCRQSTGLCVGGCSANEIASNGFCRQAALGESCQGNPAKCVSGLCSQASGVCVSGCGGEEINAGGFCRPAQVGETCQGSPQKCVTDLCHGATGQCVSSCGTDVAVGGFCRVQDGNPCGPGPTGNCRSTVCDTGSNTCKLSGGAPCTADSQCASGSCPIPGGGAPRTCAF